jgi:very-short-patch-repair endonuclease
VIVDGYLVDGFFPNENLIVELDSYEFHASKDALERDRDRDADALTRERPTVRITWSRLTNTPHKEASRLHAVLAKRRT